MFEEDRSFGKSEKVGGFETVMRKESMWDYLNRDKDLVTRWEEHVEKHAHRPCLDCGFCVILMITKINYFKR